MLINPEALIAIRGKRSRESVARRADITEEALRLLEKGISRRPRPITIHSLAQALDVPVSAITIPEYDQEAS